MGGLFSKQPVGIDELIHTLIQQEKNEEPKTISTAQNEPPWAKQEDCKIIKSGNH